MALFYLSNKKQGQVGEGKRRSGAGGLIFDSYANIL